MKENTGVNISKEELESLLDVFFNCCMQLSSLGMLGDAILAVNLADNERKKLAKQGKDGQSYYDIDGLRLANRIFCDRMHRKIEDTYNNNIKDNITIKNITIK